MVFFFSTMIIHIEGKISAADEYGERHRVYFVCSIGEMLVKSLNYCYLLINKVFGGASSLMMARMVMMMVLQ